MVAMMRMQAVTGRTESLGAKFLGAVVSEQLGRTALQLPATLHAISQLNSLSHSAEPSVTDDFSIRRQNAVSPASGT